MSSDTRGDEQDSGQRRFLRRVLADAAAHFGVRVAAGEVFSWRDRTLGCRVLEDADGGHVARWLRVTFEHFDWAYGKFWTGNVDANTLTDIPKPRVLRWYEWDEETGRNRAELMTYVGEVACSPTAEARTFPDTLTPSWWASLCTSLDRVAQHRTDRIVRSSEEVERTLRTFFGDWAPAPTRWTTCHGDLHWANLTTATPVLLDWEHWGLAPAGYDAAHLFCHSLAVPDLAETVHRQFAATLDTPDGRASQLLVIAGMLRRIDNGDYPDLTLPLHRIADRLLHRRA